MQLSVGTCTFDLCPSSSLPSNFSSSVGEIDHSDCLHHIIKESNKVRGGVRSSTQDLHILSKISWGPIRSCQPIIDWGWVRELHSRENHIKVLLSPPPPEQSAILLHIQSRNKRLNLYNSRMQEDL